MKKVILSLLIFSVVISLILLGSKYFNEDKELNNKKLLSYYIETGYQSGKYQKQESVNWPAGYVLNSTKSFCNNGSTLSWDDANNTVIVTVGRSDECKIYFDKEQTGAEYIESLLTSNPNTMNNDDPDGNIRYMGADPNNYVWFNDELWRIIGVFDIKSDENKDVEKRIKLIRDEPIGMYSWDSSTSGVNNGYGVSEWSQADLMNTFNSGAYWNRTSGTCYNTRNDGSINCDFSSLGLTEDSKKLIESAIWNTGANSAYTDFSTPEFYKSERGTNTANICNLDYCNDGISRTVLWKGYVGLMYPSDYGYATSGGKTTDRNTCLNSRADSDSWKDPSDCIVNNWLYINSTQWTITPFAETTSNHGGIFMFADGHVGGSVLADSRSVKPVVYLKSSIKITSGDGTSTNPYKLS